VALANGVRDEAAAFDEETAVLASWTLDLLFGTEIEQLVTLRDVDAVTQWLDRIRARDEHRVALAPRHTP
jgi:hypothetical protein